MNKEILIINLLEKHKHGTLSSDELKTLNAFLNEEHKDAIEDYISQKWDNASSEIPGDVKSSIVKNINDRVGKKVLKKPDRKKIRLIRPHWGTVLKYASVFIIAFGVSWILQPGKEKPTQNSSTRIKVAYGSKSTIELPDGSVVVLNSGSTLTYPIAFGSSNRTVLLEGEGFFDVQKDAKRPFLVKTKDITVKVLGTKFNVKSYSDETATEAILVSGSIELLQNENDAQHKATPIFLEPNQKAVISKKGNLQKTNTIASPEPQVTVQNHIKTELYTSWKSNVLILDNERFSDIIKKLERWYNVEISVESESLNKNRFSGKFDRESVQQVLDVLKLIQPFRYTMIKNKITIYERKDF